MWDDEKMFWLDRCNNCDCKYGLRPGQKCASLLGKANCTSIVQYSIYKSNELYDVLMNGLLPSLQESSPYTAYSTMDSWLDRLGWQDCFTQHCGNVCNGTAGPLDVVTATGAVFCPDQSSPALRDAVKHGILVALSRAAMVGVKNLATLNWIIEPLGASLSLTDTADCFPGSYVFGSGICPKPASAFDYLLCNKNDTICGWTGDACNNGCEIQIQSWYIPTCPGINNPRVYPGLLAAECILRSIVPCPAVDKLKRCATPDVSVTPPNITPN
jgi:hypothetical protein